jgi:hypothetical protein
MSSEVSFGLFGIVFVFWRDVTEVFESLMCRVGRVVRRSIIFCIRESRSRSRAFLTRHSGVANKLEKGRKADVRFPLHTALWNSAQAFPSR